MSIGATVGADLDLEGWKELDGGRDTLFEVDIFEKPDIFTFPPVCLSFGDVSDGYCLPQELPELDDDDDSDDGGNFKRDDEQPTRTTNELAPRQAKDRDYKLDCETNKQAYALDYPKPTTLINHTADPIPIIIPDVPCADAAENCEPNDGKPKVVTTQDEQQRAAVVLDLEYGEKEKWHCRFQPFPI